jgi:ATP-binding cassette subfamily G (WHITE) protein 2 (PDR)
MHLTGPHLLTYSTGGRTVYFGDIGSNSKTLIDYFTRQGGSPPAADSNPAEWMLETIGAAPGVRSDIDWPAVWRSSEEYRGVQVELQRLKQASGSGDKPIDESGHAEFAASFADQLRYATKRTFQQYWRSPAYINSKAFLTIGAVSPRILH